MEGESNRKEVMHIARLWRFAAAAVLAVALLGVFAQIASASEVPAQPQLETDATGPLFDLRSLAPGETAASCVGVSAVGEVDPVMRLHAAASGELAQFLHLTVESGSGGRYGDCSSFRGTTAFQGSLEQFAQNHGRASTAISVPAPDGAAFRFRVQLMDDPAAQGTAAAATFTWSALTKAGETISTPVTVDDPAPGAPPTEPRRQQQRTPVPSRERGGVTPPVDKSPAGPRSSDRQPQRAPAPTLLRGVTPPVDKSPAGPRSSDRQPQSAPAPTLLDQVRRFLSEAAERTAFPLVALLIVLAFVGFQHQIDRKDPKLALAPVYAEPDLPFVPPATFREVAA